MADEGGGGRAGAAPEVMSVEGGRGASRPVKRWSPAAERRFLDTLAATSCVKLASAEAGFSKVTVYHHRRNDPAFAARWQVALEQGYERVEMLLVRRAAELLEGFAPDPDTPFPAMSVGDAIRILQLHRGTVKDGVRTRRWRRRPRSVDDVRASILRKLDAIEAARRAGELP